MKNNAHTTYANAETGPLRDLLNWAPAALFYGAINCLAIAALL
jgi:hypothetical protein